MRSFLSVEGHRLVSQTQRRAGLGVLHREDFPDPLMGSEASSVIPPMTHDHHSGCHCTVSGFSRHLCHLMSSGSNTQTYELL